jgi:hypothetical protein
VNDWILNQFAWVWLGCIAFGVVAGMYSLGDAWGHAPAALAGAVGGAGTAFILSVSRYIRAGDRED